MKVERNCPNCGKAYIADSKRLEFGRQTTCSRACSYELRGKNLENNTQFTCVMCGKEFKRCVSHVKTKHGNNFCSSACHYAGRTAGLSRRLVYEPYIITKEGRAAWVEGAKKAAATRRLRDNYKHSDSTRRKLSESTTLAIASGKLKRVSGLEDKVAAYLSFFGVGHTRQAPCRDPATGQFICVFDFLIADSVVLEVNGTFWHCDPRFYPDGPTSSVQSHNLAKYAIKRKMIADLGLQLIEVWEHDFKKSPVDCVLEAIGAIA